VRRPHVNFWLIAVIALTAALYILSAWVLVQGRESRSQDEVLVDNVIAALSARDAEAVGRLFTKDAVVTFGRDDPVVGAGLKQLKAAVAGVSPFTTTGEPITLADPATGFKRPDASVDQHYVVAPVLIHDDPFVVLFDVRGGKVATQIIFEPFEPIQRWLK
jgi:hypothetical protein